MIGPLTSDFNSARIVKGRVNIGCGQAPTEAWRNFDNSLSVKLAKIPVLPNLLLRCRLLGKDQYAFIKFAKRHNIEFANARRLPLPDSSVEVLYSSHMLEHLTPEVAGCVLKEAFRVLQSGGILRLAVPDLRLFVADYLDTGDADTLVYAMQHGYSAPDSLIRRLARAFIAPRHHQWMYDGASLSRLVEKYGFQQANVMPAGETTIPNPGTLDLMEHAD
jgi:predicted SAM-dependent methyltransferase